MKRKMSRTKIEKACNEARKRVSKMSREERNRLMKEAEKIMGRKIKTIDEVCSQKPGTFDKFCKDNPDPDKFVLTNKIFDSVDDLVKETMPENVQNKYFELSKRDAEFEKDYPLIHSLGLGPHISYEPYPHIPGKQLRKALKKTKLTKQFHKYFGVNTMLVREDGDTGVYLVDIERTLRQILKGIKPTIEEWD